MWITLFLHPSHVFQQTFKCIANEIFGQSVFVCVCLMHSSILDRTPTTNEVDGVEENENVWRCLSSTQLFHVKFTVVSSRSIILFSCYRACNVYWLYEWILVVWVLCNVNQSRFIYMYIVYCVHEWVLYFFSLISAELPSILHQKTLFIFSISMCCACLQLECNMRSDVSKPHTHTHTQMDYLPPSLLLM